MCVKLSAAQEALAVHSCGTTGPLGCAFVNVCRPDIIKGWRCSTELSAVARRVQSSAAA